MSQDDIDVSDLAGDGKPTEQLWGVGTDAQTIRRFHVVGVDGKAAGQSWESSGDRCSVGSHPSNDLVIDDATVSRFHCEIRIERSGARVVDLESRNGTVLDGVPVVIGCLRHGSLLRLGRTVLRFDLGEGSNRLAVSDRTEFGSLVGTSVAMRTVFALLERTATSDATVLLEGETGTGKEGAAESIHRASRRRAGPFLVLDCGAIPETLLESELFGHERGAFTGASSRRIGVFEAANGGTVFLDEIGELPADLQPKLLRLLEKREIRRVGSNTARPIEVRVIAATNRDLRAEVNAGRFRADLYYRLAVVKIRLPPLRQRPEDIPVLVERMLPQLAPTGPGQEATASARLLSRTFLAGLQRGAWPGNVRELRNYIERCLVFDDEQPLEAAVAAAGPPPDPALSYAEARRRAIAQFERGYLEALLTRHQGRVATAARASGIDRVYLYKLLHRHGLRR